jgi:RHS repeat-associated protein
VKALLDTESTRASFNVLDGSDFFAPTDRHVTVFDNDPCNSVSRAYVLTVVLGEERPSGAGSSVWEERKFSGKDWDPDASLYYSNARWYDPQIGRFTTEDPARDGANWYAYCGNNPLAFVDPTGLAGIMLATSDDHGSYVEPVGTIILLRGHSELNPPDDPIEIAFINKTYEPLKTELQKSGYNVIDDPQKDYPKGKFGPNERAEFAKKYEGKADLMIELHYNASPWTKEGKKSVQDPTKKGGEIYYPSPASDNPRSYNAASAIAKALTDAGYTAEAKSEKFSNPKALGALGGEQVKVQHKVPAILVEPGYYTNPQEKGFFSNMANLKDWARAFAGGVNEYFENYLGRKREQ